ncbi:hypothetical protein Q5P01_000346 [Channa striata]|uniref:Uncharacterized protein n=1 Tax=Channa striata TaxID=64152 RepID=A0AA88IS28_CHASR|nr:hypothetical protein Q5P01_000346 [Channa striata]
MNSSAFHHDDNERSAECSCSAPRLGRPSALAFVWRRKKLSTMLPRPWPGSQGDQGYAGVNVWRARTPGLPCSARATAVSPGAVPAVDEVQDVVGHGRKPTIREVITAIAAPSFPLSAGAQDGAAPADGLLPKSSLRWRSEVEASRCGPATLHSRSPHGDTRPAVVSAVRYVTPCDLSLSSARVVVYAEGRQRSQQRSWPFRGRRESAGICLMTQARPSEDSKLRRGDMRQREEGLTLRLDNRSYREIGRCDCARRGSCCWAEAERGWVFATSEALGIKLRYMRRYLRAGCCPLKRLQRETSASWRGPREPGEGFGLRSGDYLYGGVELPSWQLAGAEKAPQVSAQSHGFSVLTMCGVPERFSERRGSPHALPRAA